jgi:DNA (cytosine-5)-methyltransferase 1
VSKVNLRFLDLFAGAGGLSAGFTQVAGFRPSAAVEMNISAAATYKMNHPKVPVFAGDIADWLESGAQSAEVVLGGPPCQGFSALGTRNRRDPRNAMWRRYVDTLDLVKPLYFVLENVGNFLDSGQFKSLGHETRPSGRLSEYRIEHWLLNAAEYGVPQIRKRAIVIGSRRDLPPVGKPHAYLEGQPERWATTKNAIGRLDRDVIGIDLPESFVEFEGQRLRGPFKTTDLHLGRRVSKISQARYAAIPPKGGRRDLPVELQAPCWQRHKTGAGDVMGRLHWDRPSVTIRTEFWKPEKGRYLHPDENRPITLLEGARLQGFDDAYLWCGSKTEIGRQIGNAVPVGLATAIALHLRSRLTA